MIEKFENLEGNILDPTCGSGSLLVACLIAGAKPEQIYGNELNPDFLKKCKERLRLYCNSHHLPPIPDWHFNNCNATKPEAYEFIDPSEGKPKPSTRFGRVRASELIPNGRRK